MWRIGQIGFVYLWVIAAMIPRVVSSADQPYLTVISPDAHSYTPVTTCHPGAQENLKNQIILRGFGPQQWQAEEKTCYAFAARDVLQNHICASKKCEFDEQRIGAMVPDFTKPVDVTPAAAPSATPPAAQPQETPEQKAQKDLAEKQQLAADEIYYLKLRSYPQKDLVSVADLMGDSRKAFAEGGYSQRVLSDFRKTYQIASESCAPFEAKAIRREFDSQADPSNAGTLLDSITKVGEAYRMQVGVSIMEFTPLDPCPYVRQLEPFSDLSLNSQDIITALDYYAFTNSAKDLMRLLLVPKDCPKTKVEPYQVQSYDGSRSDIARKIDENLGKAIPMTVIHCLRLPGEKDFAAKGCGPHSVVIAGSRDLCCGEGEDQVCTHQYKIRDSSRFRVSGKAGQIVDPGADDQGWEDSETFLNRIMQAKSVSHTGLIDIFIKRFRPLTWLESSR